MNGRRTNTVVGLHPGPYAIGTETTADVTVVATNSSGEAIVIGRFPLTKQMDARAQAAAYAALPDFINVLKDFFNQYPDIENNGDVSGADLVDYITLWQRFARATLIKAGIKV